MKLRYSSLLSYKYIKHLSFNIHARDLLLIFAWRKRASETAMLRNYNLDLEKHLTVVYWDQRNAEKSYDKNFPKEEIKVKKYIQDVEILVSYLKDKFRIKKIFLVN